MRVKLSTRLSSSVRGRRDEDGDARGREGRQIKHNQGTPHTTCQRTDDAFLVFRRLVGLLRADCAAQLRELVPIALEVRLQGAVLGDSRGEVRLLLLQVGLVGGRGHGVAGGGALPQCLHVRLR